MKERPILFSSSMIRAILDGRKTQTRRIIKPQPTIFEHEPKHLHAIADNKRVFCPYGGRESRLWVREAFRFIDTFDCDSPSNIAFRGAIAGYKETWAPIHYEANGQRDNWKHVGTPPHDGSLPKSGKLRPGIHMPRWASRILLEVTAVRVERLNDISEDDATAEGAEFSGFNTEDDWRRFKVSNCLDARFRHAFCELWESINGPGSWAANPWVWVVEFKRIKP